MYSYENSESVREIDVKGSTDYIQNSEHVYTVMFVQITAWDLAYATHLGFACAYWLVLSMSRVYFNQFLSISCVHVCIGTSTEKVRNGVVDLISRAYSSISLDTLAVMTGLSVEVASAACVERGWVIEADTRMVHPVTPTTEPSGQISSEDQLYKLTDFVSFLENWLWISYRFLSGNHWIVLRYLVVEFWNVLWEFLIVLDIF